MWKILQAIALFATAGLIYAKDFFRTLGINAESPLIIAVGLAITTMLMYRSTVSLLAMGQFGLLINLPEETLDYYRLDRDVLMAGAITTLILPWIHKMAQS
jgi:hypothetical protein